MPIIPPSTTLQGFPVTPEQLSDEICRAFEAMFCATPGAQLLRGPRPGWTKAVKEVMGDLGRHLGFYVAASGYRCANEREFLYDMVWYELDGNGYQTSQPMVMECEWKTALPTEVDEDFQKLVQARADLRVWVAVSANLADVERHIENCKSQIRVFKGSQARDRYVFLFFEWLSGTHVLTTFSSKEPVSMGSGCRLPNNGSC